MNDINRITANLEYITANPSARFPKGWIDETRAEARAVGILPPLALSVGCACRSGIDAGIIYGGDMEDVF